MLTLGSFVIADPALVLSPDAARTKILAAIDAAQGNRTHAARALGEEYRQFLRVIARLDLWPAIDALCEERGYAVQPGAERREKAPPRTPKARRTRSQARA